VTTFLVNMGRPKQALITAIPMVFIAVITLSAGVLSIRDIFWPLTSKPEKAFQGYLDSALMCVFIVGVVIVLVQATRRCLATLRGAPIPAGAAGPPVVDPDHPPARCC